MTARFNKRGVVATIFSFSGRTSGCSVSSDRGMLSGARNATQMQNSRSRWFLLGKLLYGNVPRRCDRFPVIRRRYLVLPQCCPLTLKEVPNSPIAKSLLLRRTLPPVRALVVSHRGHGRVRWRWIGRLAALWRARSQQIPDG